MSDRKSIPRLGELCDLVAGLGGADFDLETVTPRLYRLIGIVLKLPPSAFAASSSASSARQISSSLYEGFQVLDVFQWVYSSS